MDLITGFLFSTIIATIAYTFHALSKSGLFGAVLVGTLIIGGIGWLGLLVLAFFFVTSSLLSKLSSAKAKTPIDLIVNKGSRRDILQVLANGGVAAILSLAYHETESITLLFACIASLAAATSDTWASEIGKFSKSPPRDCLSWKLVEPGTSGAISLLGTGASIAGALCIGLVSLPLFVAHYPDIAFFPFLVLMTVSGWLGNWLDTIVGATVQAKYRCEQCGQQTEQRVHCQEPTTLTKGIYWVNNDLVNFFCTGSSAVIALLLYKILMI